MIWYGRLCSPASRRHGMRLSVDDPMDTVTTVGIGGAGAGGGDWYWMSDGRPERRRALAEDGKPPYRVPSMAEIAAVPSNGLSVVSTFSGTGGSCLGFRMAGYRILWASEFVEAARASYAANMAPGTILDGRDIREVTPEDVLRAIGKRPGEVDVMEGSPPCASFSTAGKREAHWGKSKSYSDTRQRTDDLFFEFARLLRGIRPKTFVAENVSGLIKGTAKGYFLEILAELKGCGYRVEAKLLDAQWLGVPQARQRLIFVGVRTDLGLAPAFPKPLPYRYSVRDALPWIAGLTFDNGGGFPNSRQVFDVDNDPCRAITMPAGGGSIRFTVEAEADISRFAIGAEWDKLKQGEVSGKYLSLIKCKTDAPSYAITASGGSSSRAGPVHPTEKRKFGIAELKRICGFPDDFELVGSYAQRWERLGRAVPPLMMKAVAETVRDGVLVRLPRGRAA